MYRCRITLIITIVICPDGHSFNVKKLVGVEVEWVWTTWETVMVESEEGPILDEHLVLDDLNELSFLLNDYWVTQ